MKIVGAVKLSGHEHRLIISYDPKIEQYHLGACLSIFLFKKYSEKKAILSFEEQLKKWGISSRNIQLNDLYKGSGYGPD
jgi:hypothetical protein